MFAYPSKQYLLYIYCEFISYIYCCF